MKVILINVLIVLALSFCVSDADAQRGGFRHGQTHQSERHGFVVWDNRVKRWVSPRRFWNNYAKRKGDRYWGQRRFYPSSRFVKEHDLITINTSNGSCLMEYYHGRWRRANDVWRWNRRFNQYSGCSNVHRQRSRLFFRR